MPLRNNNIIQEMNFHQLCFEFIVHFCELLLFRVLFDFMKVDLVLNEIGQAQKEENAFPIFIYFCSSSPMATQAMSYDIRIIRMTGVGILFTYLVSRFFQKNM